MADRELRCHWCDGKIDSERGFWKLEAFPGPKVRETIDGASYACWYCGLREIHDRIGW